MSEIDGDCECVGGGALTSGLQLWRFQSCYRNVQLLCEINLAKAC